MTTTPLQQHSSLDVEPLILLADDADGMEHDDTDADTDTDGDGDDLLQVFETTFSSMDDPMEPIEMVIDDGVIVVAMVDGTMAGLSRATGQTLWKRGPNPQPTASSSLSATHRIKTAARDNSEAPPLLEPLVSTTTTTTVGSSGRWRTAAVPSILDGKVYLTASGQCQDHPKDHHHHHHSNGDCGAGDEEDTVTSNIRHMVDRAPFVDRRGRIYTAQRRSVAVAVDGQTGEMVHTMAAAPNAPWSDLQQQQQQPRRSGGGGGGGGLLWMGRVDYTVSIHEPRTGELDVQFSVAELMSVHDMLLDDRSKGEDNSSPWNSNTGIQHLLSQSQSHDDDDSLVAGDVAARSRSNHRGGQPRASERRHKAQSVVATPSGHVAFRDPATGIIAWIAAEAFATPVAFALDSTTGRSLGVEIVPDAVVPHGSAAYVTQEMQRQLELRRVRRPGGDALSAVDSWNGDDAEEPIFGSLPASGQIFAMPLGKAPPEFPPHANTKASSAATHTALEPHKDHHGSPTITAAGRHHANFYHDSPQHGAQPQACSPGSPNFPRCLTGRESLSSRTKNRPQFFRSDSSPFDVRADGAVVPFYHPDYGYQYIPPDQFYTINDFHHNRRRYQKLLRLFGSWLAPLIALIFVSV